MATRSPYPGTESSSDFLTTTNFDKLPGGLIGYAKVTTTQTFTTISGALTGLTLTVTPVTASRNLLIRWSLPILNSTTGSTAEGANIYLYKAGSQVALSSLAFNTNTATQTIQSFYIDVAPAASATTYDLRGARYSGSSATYTVNASATIPGWLSIDDVGVTF